MGRSITLMMIVVLLGVLGWNLGTHVIQAHSEVTRAQQRAALQAGFDAAGNDLKAYVESYMASNGASAIPSPPTSYSNTVDLCANGTLSATYCSTGDSTATYTATLVSNPLGVANTGAAVYGGGQTRSTANFNIATDNNGHPFENKITYRLHVTFNLNGTQSVAAINGVIEGQIINAGTQGIVMQVVSAREDSSATSGASIGYTDTLCGDSTLGCNTLTAGADTTVVNAEKHCFDAAAAGDSTLGSHCAPVGMPSATPKPNNNFANKQNADGSNSNSGVAP